MRFAETTQIVISEDDATVPLNKKFEDSVNDVDLTSIAKLHDSSDAYPVGTTDVSMGSITTGKFLWVRPERDVSITLSGGDPIVFKGGKASKLWATFDQVEVTVANTAQNTTSPPEVEIVIGG